MHDDTLGERAASLEARVEELTRAFHDHVERAEQHQQMMLKELSDLRLFLHGARTVGQAAIWLGGSILALVSVLLSLTQWLRDHIVFKP